MKEAIDDLEWPGSSIQIGLQPDPPCVTFRGEGHGDLQVLYKIAKLGSPGIIQRIDVFFLWQIDFMYYANTDLLIAFQCDRAVSYRYVVIALHFTDPTTSI